MIGVGPELGLERQSGIQKRQLVATDIDHVDGSLDLIVGEAVEPRDDLTERRHVDRQLGASGQPREAPGESLVRGEEVVWEHDRLG